MANLFATVGSNQVIVWSWIAGGPALRCTCCLQATIYDDTHMGKYISVVMQLTNTATQHSAGGVSLGRLLLGLHQMELSAELQTRCNPQSLMCTCLLPFSYPSGQASSCMCNAGPVVLCVGGGAHELLRAARGCSAGEHHRLCLFCQCWLPPIGGYTARL